MPGNYQMYQPWRWRPGILLSAFRAGGLSLIGWCGNWSGLMGFVVPHALVGEHSWRGVHLYSRLQWENPTAVTAKRERLQVDAQVGLGDILRATKWVGRLRSGGKVSDDC